MATKLAQVRRLNYNGEDIGMGFNSDTGLGIGVALDFAVRPGDLSQEAISDVTIVTSHEQLMTKLHMSAQLEGRYSIVSGGGKTDFVESTQYNSSSTFVVARMLIQNTVTRGKDFKLKPDLQHLLDTQADVFDKAFGDSFVRAHYRGGEFYAVMRVTSDDSKTESNLAVSLHAEFTTGGAGGSFKGDLEKAKSDQKTHSEFSVHFYQKGGVGENEIGTTLDVDEIKKRLKAFPDAVRNHPFPYFIEVATYDTIPLLLPTKEQQEDFLIALADADAKKLKYLQSRNDCEFAAEHPEYFSDPPARQVLLAMAATFVKLVNGAIDHAIALSKGQIPPHLFDPSQLVPPVTEPEVVLRKRDVGLEGTFADFWTTKDKPATRKNDRDLVIDIGFAAKSAVNAFDQIVDPGGDPLKTLQLQGEALTRVVASFQSYNWDHAGLHDSSREPLTSLSALPAMLPRTIKALAFPPFFSKGSVSKNAIQNTKGLEQFTALVSLDLSANALNSIAELGSLTLLRDLSMADNAVSDLGPLRTCGALETLDISGNDIADLTPLGACKALKNLILAGTTFFENGVQSRSHNPIVNALVLAEIPAMANPLTLGRSLAVRFGVLSEGPAAQFTGTATRIGDSLTFRVRMNRAGEVIDDVWKLRRIAQITPGDGKEMALFSPGAVASDFPLTGIVLGITPEKFAELNLSYVDPTDPRKAGIDLTAFPIFGSKVIVPTFDLTVVS
jgi:hypothetical protein